MKNDGHLAGLTLSRDKAVTAAHGDAELLQQAAVSAGQGICSFWINQLIMRRLYGKPAEMAGVVTGQVKLRLQGQGRQQQGQQQQSLPHHTLQN